MTKKMAMPFDRGCVIFFRTASPTPMPPTTPNLADISCSNTVAAMENNIAQSKVYPYEAPAMVAVVTVPGPIKAAATMAPGPICFNFFSIKKRVRQMRIYFIDECHCLPSGRLVIMSFVIACLVADGVVGRWLLLEVLD
jgi:hypothetical protein